MGMFHKKGNGTFSSLDLDSKKFCKSFVKQHFKYEKKGGDLKKMSKHHPCQVISEEDRLECADDYEMFHEKCKQKDLSKKKFKDCFKKECEKNLEDKNVCIKMEKQSRKYQKKINKQD